MGMPKKLWLAASMYQRIEQVRKEIKQIKQIWHVEFVTYTNQSMDYSWRGIRILLRRILQWIIAVLGWLTAPRASNYQLPFIT